MKGKSQSSALVLFGLVVGMASGFFLREMSGAGTTILKGTEQSHYLLHILAVQVITLFLYFRNTIKAFSAFLLCFMSGILPVLTLSLWLYYNDPKKITSDIEITTMVFLCSIGIALFFIAKYFVNPKKKFKSRYNNDGAEALDAIKQGKAKKRKATRSHDQ